MGEPYGPPLRRFPVVQGMIVVIPIGFHVQGFDILFQKLPVGAGTLRGSPVPPGGVFGEPGFQFFEHGLYLLYNSLYNYIYHYIEIMSREK
jgi:hypothetical protein